MAVRPGADAHERRVARRLEARGQPGLGEALSRMRGCVVSGRWRVGALYAVGAEGAVFVVSDIRDPAASPKVGKIALLPYHRPAELSSADLRRHREALRTEARDLTRSASPYMPQSHGLHEMINPLLDVKRGGPFAEPEPILLMERLAGFDVDLWLARVHRSGIPRAILRPHLDRVAVVLLRALHDLQERGYFYADLRPGNLRVLGRPARRIRLLDAGSLVEVGDTSGKFPHVPHYLPPDLFRAYHVAHSKIVPSAAVQAVMAGRTLFEAATGIVPVPGEPIDAKSLADSGVSSPIADVIDGLVSGSFSSVVPALKYLSRRAAQRPQTTPVAAARPKVSPVRAEPPYVPAPVALRASPVPANPVPVAPAPAARVPATPAPATPVPVTHVPAAPAPVARVPATPAAAARVPATQVPAPHVPVRRVPATPAAAKPVPVAHVPTAASRVNAAPARPAPVRAAAARPAPAKALPAKAAPAKAAPRPAAPARAVPAKAATAKPALAAKGHAPRAGLVGRILDALIPSRRARRAVQQRVVPRRPLAGSSRL